MRELEKSMVRRKRKEGKRNVMIKAIEVTEKKERSDSKIVEGNRSRGKCVTN